MAAPASKPFAVFYGGEDFILDRERMRARTWVGRQVVQLTGDDLTDVELVDILGAATYDESLRVVILDEANKLKGDKALKQFIQDKSETDLSTILVAIVRSEKLPDLWAFAAKKGTSREFPRLKDRDYNNEVLRWITAEAKSVGIRLAKGVEDMLFEILGHDLGRLAGELRKLQLLVGRGNEATPAHVALVISPSPHAAAWQVAEAAGNKDFRLAVKLLSSLYKSEGDDASVPVAFSLMKQIENLMVVRYMVDAKMSEEDIATALGVNPKRVKYGLIPLVRKHSMPDLVKNMARLSQLDSIVKSAAQSKRTHVELAVHQVCS